MKINFVTESPTQRWILRRWCEEWTKYILESTITSDYPMQGAVNIYVNYALFQTKGALDIAYFTHREENATLAAKFDWVAGQVDWCIAQSTTTLKKLPKKKSSIIRPGVDEQFKKGPIKLGIAGRVYDRWGNIPLNDRKRYHWVDKLSAIKEIYDNFQFVLTDGKIAYEEINKFYEEIDYLLVTASNEGGPMPLIESLAMGKPVIAPKNVGWCSEFSVLQYKDFDDLVKLLQKLYWPPNDWETSANQIIKLIDRLL